MKVDSTLYGLRLEFDKKDLSLIYDLYERWHDEHHISGFIGRNHFINNPDASFDHVAFHASCLDGDLILELMKSNKKESNNEKNNNNRI